MTKRKSKISLLNPEATGGDIAGGGTSFEDQVILGHIPLWLADESFTMMIREALGDVEASFFVPGQGFAKEFFEVKNHAITPAEFKQELRRFQELADGSPGTYRRFTLVSPGASQRLEPVFNGLRRIRGPQAFYAGDHQIRDSSFADFAAIVKRLGHTDQDARFLFEQVELVNLTSTQIGGVGPFSEQLAKTLSEYQHLSFPAVQHVYRALSQLIHNRNAIPITRRELEIAIEEALPAEFLPTPRSIIIYTGAEEREPPPARAVYLNWARFWGGDNRSYPVAEEWNAQLLAELHSLREWIKRDRGRKQVLLTGQRRLSASIAFGTVFSAVSQFVIDVDLRDQLWSTRDYQRPDTPPYELSVQEIGGDGDRLVVSIAIARIIAAEVEQALAPLGLQGLPILHMAGPAVVSSAHANAAAAALKAAIVNTLARTQAKQIDLFFAGPAHVAVFLGHRLNAVAPIQCYEWVATNRYVPTCRLTSG